MRAVAIWMAFFVAANVLLAYTAPELTTYVNQRPGRDKTGHFVLMGVFALLVTSSIPDRRVSLGSFAVPTGVLLVLVAATLEELSQQYGISRERVRQIEVRAFEKLQKSIRNQAIEERLATP